MLDRLLFDFAVSASEHRSDEHSQKVPNITEHHQIVEHKNATTRTESERQQILHSQIFQKHRLSKTPNMNVLCSNVPS